MNYSKLNQAKSDYFKLRKLNSNPARLVLFHTTSWCFTFGTCARYLHRNFRGLKKIPGGGCFFKSSRLDAILPQLVRKGRLILINDYVKCYCHENS
jgi:hypothetical protein